MTLKRLVDLTNSNTIHLHAPAGPCRTVCGLPCDSVAVAYGGTNPEVVSCAQCLSGARGER